MNEAKTKEKLKTLSEIELRTLLLLVDQELKGRVKTPATGVRGPRSRNYTLHRNKEVYHPRRPESAALGPPELISERAPSLGLAGFEAIFSKHHLGGSMFEEDDV